MWPERAHAQRVGGRSGLNSAAERPTTHSRSPETRGARFRTSRREREASAIQLSSQGYALSPRLTLTRPLADATFGLIHFMAILDTTACFSRGSGIASWHRRHKPILGRPMAERRCRFTGFLEQRKLLMTNRVSNVKAQLPVGLKLLRIVELVRRGIMWKGWIL